MGRLGTVLIFTSVVSRGNVAPLVVLLLAALVLLLLAPNREEGGLNLGTPPGDAERAGAAVDEDVDGVAAADAAGADVNRDEVDVDDDADIDGVVVVLDLRFPLNRDDDVAGDEDITVDAYADDDAAVLAPNADAVVELLLLLLSLFPNGEVDAVPLLLLELLLLLLLSLFPNGNADAVDDVLDFTPPPPPNNAAVVVGVPTLTASSFFGIANFLAALDGLGLATPGGPEKELERACGRVMGDDLGGE